MNVAPQDFREMLENEGLAVEREGDWDRDSFKPTERLVRIYKRLEAEEQRRMRRIICEWMLEKDSKKRYDAINIARVTDSRGRGTVEEAHE